MIDSVKLSSPEEVIAFVEAALTHATASRWDWRRSAENAELMSWAVFPLGDQPRWNNRWVVHAPQSGEYFIVIHSNETHGVWSLAHAMQTATFISRFTLGMSTREGGPSSLALMLRRIFETTQPNVWDPT